jgi:hypothetical protein
MARYTERVANVPAHSWRNVRAFNCPTERFHAPQEFARSATNVEQTSWLRTKTADCIDLFAYGFALATAGVVKKFPQETT